jgi:hypothetical protein
MALALMRFRPASVPSSSPLWLWGDLSGSIWAGIGQQSCNFKAHMQNREKFVNDLFLLISFPAIFEKIVLERGFIA